MSHDEFRVRRSGVVIPTKDGTTVLTESGAWRLFMDTCKGGGPVELLRGAKAVAWSGEKPAAASKEKP